MKVSGVLGGEWSRLQQSSEASELWTQQSEFCF